MMGGMGVVYFALDYGNDGRPVALKTFRPELLPDRAARDRFLREGTAWVELGSHPHIVRCYKVEYIDPTVFLVLELIAKEQNMPDASLRSWLIPGRPLPLEQALLFALQIARGMQYATEKIPGFVHRDLKPENILVGVDKLPGTSINRLRVTDFGLAKALTEIVTVSTLDNTNELKPSQIQFTRGVGTPLYMAPEQWKGEPVSMFTDVYAFGCTLYEMLSGQHVVEGNTITELHASHSEGRLRPLPLGLPEDLMALITKCLALQPKERYQDWKSVIETLDTAYAGQGMEKVKAEMPAQDVGLEQSHQVGGSYNAVGVAYLHMGKAELATSYFEKALALMREAGDRRGEGNALGNLGTAYADLGNAGRAVEYYKQYLELAREIGDRRGEGNALGNLGSAYLNLGEARQAIGYYEQQIQIAHEILDRYGESNALGNLGNAYAALGETRQAIEYYKQYLEIVRQISDRRGEGNVLGSLGNAYAALGEVHQAIVYYEQQIQIAREIGDRRGEGNALDSLGNALIALGDARRAIEYHEQALMIAREIGDRRAEGYFLANIGTAFTALGEAQRAIAYLEQALAIRREIRDLNGIAIDLFNLALLYARQGETWRALPLAEEAAQIWDNIGHQDYGQRTKRLVAQLKSHISMSLKPSPAQILAEFGAWLDAIVAAARGDAEMQALVEANFEQFEQSGWNIAEPVLRIWAGERDIAGLTEMLDENDSLIVREVLNRLESLHTDGVQNVENDHAKAAFVAFHSASNPQEMEVAVGQYPLLKEAQFIRALEKIIREQAPPEQRSLLEARLKWLRNIVGS
jgi:tetratricopeptide (TPR) repeat protein